MAQQQNDHPEKHLKNKPLGSISSFCDVSIFFRIEITAVQSTVSGHWFSREKLRI
jgi:hypothetical protein